MLKRKRTPQNQWDDTLPFRRFNSMMQVFSALPTLPMHEWTCRYLVLVCLRHAVESQKLELLQCAIGAAVTTSMLSKTIARKDDVRYPAQATIMVGPRQALHEHELLICALYVASLAARRHGGLVRGALGEAALAGLLTHLFCAPADANGPRFLWWTWHESHPAVRSRTLNFPVTQALAEMSLGASFSLLSGWFLDSFRRSSVPGEDSLGSALKEVIHWLPDYNRPLLQLGSSFLDNLRETLREGHFLPRIALVSLCAPALHTLLSGIIQMIALDKVGSPSVRSYKAMLAVFALWASSSQVKTLPVTISDSKAGARLAASVVAYFAVQSVIPFIGDAKKHVSTGCHQLFGKAGEYKKDAFGNKYEQNLSNAEYEFFTVEGSTRAALVQELEEKREALDDVALFLKAADKRVGDTELALQETQQWSKQAQSKVPQLREDAEFVRDLEATNSVRLARIKAHLEGRLDRIKAERTKIASFEHKLRAKIARLEDLLEVGSIDPAGNPIIPASPVGPASVWYTIRGVIPKGTRKTEESFGIFLLSLLGMTAFTRALAFGA